MSKQSQGDQRRREGRGPIVVILVATLVIIACVSVVVAIALGQPGGTAPREGRAPDPVQLANTSERVDLAPDGIIYVNNELVVYTIPGVEDGLARELFSSVGATSVDGTMADLGLYRLVFSESLSYEDLTTKLTTLNESPLVESAALNPVVSAGADAEEAVPMAANYPNDPWDKDDWDVSRPRGENWGVEAIDAPGAWGYLDQLSTTRVGLIDTVPQTDHEDLEFADSTVLVINESTGTLESSPSAVAEDHGTHVAGTIAARYNNGKGISGIMGNKAELYYCGAFYYDGSDYSSRYATAYSYLLQIKTLVDKDVRAINISQNTGRLIGFAASHGNSAAINYLNQQADLTERGLIRLITERQEQGLGDFVICVSAGNSNDTTYYPDEDSPYGYSESYGLKNFFKGEKGNSLASYNNFLALMDASEVKDRIIVVGNIGIDWWRSLGSKTVYEYASSSCVGDRVDVVAPGMNVYSCTTKGYEKMSGTSMSAPHVTGVAGLIFAANPKLSGPDVKRIVLGTTEGRYYYGGNYSGLVNACTAVEQALKTRSESVSRVVSKKATNGLDLCFVVDTTGSMGDDIENARQNMEQILSGLSERTENYRVALVDYRDFASRTGYEADYACRTQLDFTSDNTTITQTIDNLDLGYGGDNEETVYSALMQAVQLDWRDDAKKVIIVLGDAAPLDPEPSTGYTYQDVATALYNGGIGIDYASSDARVLGDPDNSLINVFSIGTDASSDAMDFFDEISSDTGGSSVDIDDASEVSDAISSSIDQIEVEAGVTAELDFGSDMAGARIDLYSADGIAVGTVGSDASADSGVATDGTTTSAGQLSEPGDYLFSFTTDSSGRFTVDALPAGNYVWTTDAPTGGGTLRVSTGSATPTLTASDSFWFSPVMRAWSESSVLVVCGLALVVAACITAPLILGHVTATRSRRSKNLPSNPSPVGGTHFCPQCGNPLPSGAHFCARCGRHLD